jgi:outer membrane protein
MRRWPGLFLLAGALCFGQPQAVPAPGVHWYDRLAHNYEPSTFPAASFQNSSRIDSLLRAGKLYLSLEDAIALALENNLDIELQRYSTAIAASDLLRARGGASTLRGIQYGVNQLPQGVGGPASPLLNLPASGYTQSSSVATGLPELAAIVPSQTTAQIQGSFSTGTLAPIFDPAIVGNLNWEHASSPQVTSTSAGAGALTGSNLLNTFGVQKDFSAGTSVNLSFNSLYQNTNTVQNIYNPNTSSNLGLNITQPLLRGFGASVNRRFIRIAQNNQRVSGLVFRQQVIETVAGVIRLYFDLVSLVEDVGVKRQTLALAEQLYQDNKEKVEQGTLAPIELVRAQAQVAAARQDLANSEGFELQQELIVKTVLTRRGTADPLIRTARIVTTTPIDIPAREEVRPAQDLVAEAYRSRPELEEGRLQITNSRISMQGSKNALLPELNLVGIAQNSGLGGQLNPFGPLAPGFGFTASGDQPFVGGFGSSLAQIFRRNYPTYGVGVELNLPLKNRVAQGDYARDEISVRQTEIRFQQLENQVRVEVEGALIATERARAAYDAAVETRKLQEQSLQIEMEKYDNGLSTTFLVMQYQSYVAQARSTEVAARGVYIKARTALERATGETLQNHNISIEDVYRGRVAARPARVP